MPDYLLLEDAAEIAAWERDKVAPLAVEASDLLRGIGLHYARAARRRFRPLSATHSHEHGSAG
jgi:hypothetical protein